jgi:hypothetical protein
MWTVFGWSIIPMKQANTHIGATFYIPSCHTRTPCGFIINVYIFTWGKIICIYSTGGSEFLVRLRDRRYFFCGSFLPICPTDKCTTAVRSSERYHLDIGVINSCYRACYCLFYSSLNDTFLIALAYMQSSEWLSVSNEQARMRIKLPNIFQDMIPAFVFEGLRKTTKYPMIASL